MVEKIKQLLFVNRDTKQTIAKNAAWLSVSNIGGRLIRAVIIVYAARVLGAAEYGVFSYVLGLAGFFTVFADIGINNILTREATQKPEQSEEYFATAFWIKVALLCITSLIIVFIAPTFSGISGAAVLVPFIAIVVAADGIRELANAYFRAKERMEWEALTTLFMNATITGTGFLILSYSATASALTFSYIASAAVGMIAAALILHKEFSHLISHFRKALVSPMLRAALPIALLSVLGPFMLSADIVMLGWWRSPEEIGFYSAAQKIIQVFYTLPAILAASVFPVLSRAAGDNNIERARAIMEKIVTFLFFVSIPMVVGGVVLGSPIIEFLYDFPYLPAAPAFQILIATILFTFPGALFGNLALAYHEQKKLAPYVFAAAIANIALNVWLIPLWGILGSAIATLIAQTTYNALTWRLAKKLTQFRSLRYLGKIATAALGMGVVAWALDGTGIHVLFTIAISGASYFALLAIFRERVIKDFFSLVAHVRGVPGPMNGSL